MEIKISIKNDLKDRTTKTRQVTPGYSLPSCCIIRDKDIAPGRRYFKLHKGKSDLSEIDGKDVLITGLEYIIGHRRYDLQAGFGLKARLTSNFTLIPHLRQARGREVNITKDPNGVGNNGHWPAITMLPEVE